MALTSPALTLAVEALWGNVKPVLDGVRKLGFTDFSADRPNLPVKPGATVKVPISSIAKAAEYNESSNHYRTGGSTSWATLTAKHYLQGFDITGVDVDQGVDAARMKQLFTMRAGAGIAMAVQAGVKTALDGTTASTAVTLKAAGTATVDDYLNIADSLEWLDRASACLAVNGSELGAIKAKLAAANIIGTPSELAAYMGFKDIVLVPGMSARMCIVPAGTLGLIARVPEIIARYMEVGTETDPDTGLSVGIVVADDQDHNRLIANADLWFGVATLSAPAAAGTAGIIKVGTAS